MKARIMLALALLASTASAETLHNGRVYQVTADHYATREHMACTYGPFTRFVTLADGRLAMIRVKRCEKTNGNTAPIAPPL